MRSRLSLAAVDREADPPVHADPTRPGGARRAGLSSAAGTPDHRAQIRAVMGHGAQAVDSAGSHLGHITDVLLGADTSRPTWMTVDCVSCTGIGVVVPRCTAGS